MLVKICGITSMSDAEAAVEAGAAALGFVFWPKSPRFIDPYRARAIASSLPPFVTPVGVFVDQRLEYVTGVAALVRLGAVQLHGEESVAYAGSVPYPVIKAVAIDPEDAQRGDGAAAKQDRGAGAPGVIDVNDVDPIDRVEMWPRRTTLLLDRHDPVRHGGTGHTIDWSAAALIAARRRTILAGGLTPDNVAEAVARVRPFGIDVSSGVERSPGVKDHARIRAFFEALNGRYPSRS